MFGLFTGELKITSGACLPGPEKDASSSLGVCMRRWIETPGMTMSLMPAPMLPYGDACDGGVTWSRRMVNLLLSPAGTATFWRALVGARLRFTDPRSVVMVTSLTIGRAAESASGSIVIVLSLMGCRKVTEIHCPTELF